MNPILFKSKAPNFQHFNTEYTSLVFTDDIILMSIECSTVCLVICLRNAMKIGCVCYVTTQIIKKEKTE